MYLDVRSLTKFHGNNAVVSDLSLSLSKGELVGLLGPSGCGKTTTLRMVGGLTEATSGKVFVGGRDVTSLPPHQRNMGVMFQSYALFPHMTIAENVAFGLEMRKLAKAEIAKKVMWALKLVQMEILASRKPRQLSGGQQQRVALARSLVIEPDMLLLDEPLSNLDAKLRDEMRSEIRTIQKNLNITTLFVTHDQTEAMAVCDRIAVMRSGTLEQIGSPLEVYERPANPFVAGFVGRINRLQGTWSDKQVIRIGSSIIRADRAGKVGRPVAVMMRPHRIKISPGPELGSQDPQQNYLLGLVRRATFLGDSFHYEVESEGALIFVEVQSQSGHVAIADDESVRLTWPISNTLTFDAVTS